MCIMLPMMTQAHAMARGMSAKLAYRERLAAALRTLHRIARLVREHIPGAIITGWDCNGTFARYVEIANRWTWFVPASGAIVPVLR